MTPETLSVDTVKIPLDKPRPSPYIPAVDAPSGA
jgi:hypothetical protein